MTYGSEPIYFGITFSYDEMVDIYKEIGLYMQKICHNFLPEPLSNLVHEYSSNLAMKNIFVTLKRELVPLGLQVSYWGRPDWHSVTDSSTLCEIPFYQQKLCTEESVLKWFREPDFIAVKENFYLFARKIGSKHMLTSIFCFQGSPLVF